MRSLRLALVAALLVFGGPSRALAQVVRGQVKDRTTGNPAHGVVTLVDTSGTLIGRTPTGPQGQYVLPAPGPGGYLLQFVGPGYGPYVSTQFSLGPGETRIMGLQAVPLPTVVLDTVVVEGRPVPRRLAGFYERKSRGGGDFITREDFERFGPTAPTQIMRRMSGVSLVPSDAGWRVVSRRNQACAPAVFLDGVYMGTGAEFDFDAVLTVEQIEGVEVYSGAGTIPPEFSRGDCGAVVVWTRLVGPGQVATASHFYVGPEAGGWTSSNGLQNGRVGMRAVIALGAVEISPAAHVLVPGFRSGSAIERTGTEIEFTLRGRPLGLRSPWYVGVGSAFLSLEERNVVNSDEQYFVVLTGLGRTGGRLRPFVELQAFNNFSFHDVRFQVFAGAVVRVY